ncbi:MAG: glycoside hydrolase 5 family protein, partial [Thermoguttaceae bacterium]
LWQPATGGIADPAAAVDVYFDLLEYDTSVPLLARLRQREWGRPAPLASWSPADYARDAYGDAWDFNQDDEFEGIDVFGNRPECFRNRQVKGGLLSWDVSQDPYIIWGDMWSGGMRTKRKVAIDLDAYPLLEMRVRQSCPRAEWAVMGRADSPQLMQHEFPVVGTEWQTIRIHLVKDAQFGGVLQAFRIDTTSDLDDVHVEIDWIRLTNEAAATREPIELVGDPDRVPAALSLQVDGRFTPAGGSQKVIVRATDGQGLPVRGQPVTVRVQTGSDGHLEAAPGWPSLTLDPKGRRGLTDAEGRLEVVHVCSRLAGPQVDMLAAIADRTNVRAAPVAVDTLPGPPHHYRVTPERAVTLREAQFPIQLSVQLVDELDNPLPAAGRRVQLSAADGLVEPALAATDQRGQVTATLDIDAGKRWVYQVAVKDTDGLAGTSGKITVALDSARPNSIRLLPNGYFAYADGQPFVPLGGFYANWVQSETPDGEWGQLRSFTDTTDEEKCRWMEFLQQQGVTAMRLMLRTHRRDGMEPLDVVGHVNQPLLAEAVRYMDLARRYNLQFQVVLHEDYTKPAYFDGENLRRYCLPQFAGEDLDALPAEQRRFLRDGDLIAPIALKYTDPDVIACQDRYARELLSILRTNGQVFAFELENEMVECPAAWANHAIGTIREVDPLTPVCVSHGGGGLATADPLWWHRNVRIDFYNYHLYPHGRTTTPEIDYGAATNVLTRYGRMCGPSLLGESAGDQFSQHPSVETRRLVMRDLVWISLCNGNPGVFFWNARGPEVREFKPARDAMGQLALATFRRARPEIGIDVRFTADDDKYFRTSAGEAAWAMMGRYSQYYAGQGIDFDFTLEPEKYPLHSTLEQFQPAEPKQRPLRPSPGWQLNYLAREDYRELLVYVRNFAGVDLWECKLGGDPCRQYLRRRAPAPMKIALGLPPGQYQLTLYDLDTQQAEPRSVAADGILDLGATDHDFAMVLKRQ